MSYEQLIREHDAIEALANKLISLANGSDPKPEQAGSIISKLAENLRNHLDWEDVEIYPELLRSRNREDHNVADRFTGELNNLKFAWRTFLMSWNEKTISEHWDMFQSEAITMMRRLSERTRNETTLLYPLTLQRSIINLRD